MICPKCGSVVKKKDTRKINKQLQKVGVYNYRHKCGAFLENHFALFGDKSDRNL